MIFNVTRYEDHGAMRLQHGLNGNVVPMACTPGNALNSAYIATAGECRVFRYFHTTKNWTIEVHHRDGSRRAWQRAFSSSRASLHVFNDVCAALLRSSLTSPSAEDVATYIAETFDMERV